mgnify:CR=1 FL=1
MVNPLSNSDALGGMQACPRRCGIPDCDYAVLPVRNYRKIPVLVIPRHRNAPPPPKGAGLAQGGQSYFEKRISTQPIRIFPFFYVVMFQIVIQLNSRSAVVGVTVKKRSGFQNIYTRSRFHCLREKNHGIYTRTSRSSSTPPIAPRTML